LEDLAYSHNKIGGAKNAKTKQEIQQLIDQVEKL